MVAKIIKPQLFPSGCNAWRQIFNVDKEHYSHYFYTNKDGRNVFIVVVDNNPNYKKKRIDQGSYNNGHYVRENIWTKVEGYKLPLFNLHELLETDKPIYVHEGEKCAVAGQKLFPNSFSTCYQGGRSAWKDRIDWSVLQGKEVTLINDIDSDGKGSKEWIKLSRYLKSDFGIEAKVTNFPNYSEIKTLIEQQTGEEYNKSSWDICDIKIDHLDLDNIISNAKVPEPLSEYSDIDSDIKNKRWIFISKSGKLYYDRFKNTYCKDTEINQLYKRDPDLDRLAVTYLNQEGIDYVDTQTFRPGGDFIIKEGKTKLLNKYVAPTFIGLEDMIDKEYVPYSEETKWEFTYDISFFRDHIKLLSNDDPKIQQAIEDMIAWDITYPGENRTWALLFHSGQGVGKTMFFKALKQLYGVENCSDLDIDQLVDKYQPHMLNSCYFFINEVDSTGKDVKSKQAKIRSLIADTDFMVEMKGVDLIPITKCHYTIFGATNEAVPMYIPKDDRRTFFVSIDTTRYEVLFRDPNYYKKLKAFVEDPTKITELYYHYRYVHEISESFNPNEAPSTLAKDELIEASKPQFMKVLDKYFEDKKLDCFKFDIVNAKQIFLELNTLDLTFENQREHWTENKVLRWIRDNPQNFKILKGEAYQIPGKSRGRCWCVRNHETWSQYKLDKEYIDSHFKNEIKTFPNQKELLNKSVLSSSTDKGGKYDKIPF